MLFYYKVIFYYFNLIIKKSTPQSYKCFFYFVCEQQSLFLYIKIQAIFERIFFLPILCNSGSPIKSMWGDCFCFGQTKRNPNLKGKYTKEISSRLLPEQISILTMIFDDLASRNEQNKLTFQNFLNFFNLTGLWGAKLFKQFDQDRIELIGLQEFLYGISQTAKASFNQKIKLLYCFFEQDINAGIQFKNFVKMLYNYSKDELKQFLIQDKIISASTRSYSQKSSNSQDNVVQFDLKSPVKKPSTAFQEAYNALLNIHDEGTYLEITSKQLKYKIKYCNMCTLVKQFAQKVYLQHGINVNIDKKGRLSYENFCNWIKSHKKLFKSYYSAFHAEIWSINDNQPSYMNQKVDMEFNGRIQCAKMKCQIYAFQVEDLIIFCQDKKSKRKPIKIICLEGLAISDIGDLKIQIAHRSDCYKNCIIIFDKQSEHKEWLYSLAIYQRESLNINYIIRQVIGTGKFSIVYKCIQKSSGKQYALKVVQLEKLTKNAKQAISNQSEILKILNHQQILKYIDTIYTKTHEYIITQYIYGEDLYEYVKKRKFLNQFESAFIIGNVMKAVMYLHELQIIHRDIKPQNIMVMFKDKKQGEYFECTTPLIRKGQRIQNIKIIDFGLSNHISKLEKMDKKKLVAGTPNYIAPQLLLAQPITLKSDAFSIGSVLYFLLKGTLPFAECNAEKTLLNTIQGAYDIQSPHWDHISSQAKDLLIKLLEIDPNKRIQLKQAVNHEWFTRIFSKTRSSNSSFDQTTQTNKKNSFDDEKQKYRNSNNRRKVSTSQSKYKDIQKSRHSK